MKELYIKETATRGKRIINSILCVIGLFLPIPVDYKPIDTRIRIGKQWFGFSLTVGYVPLGWIIVAVAYLI